MLPIVETADKNDEGHVPLEHEAAKKTSTESSLFAFVASLRPSNGSHLESIFVRLHNKCSLYRVAQTLIPV